MKFLKVEFQFFHQKEQEKIPEKIQVSKDDLAELQNTAEAPAAEPLDATEDAGDASLDEMQAEEAQANEQEDTEATNS